MHYIVSGKAVSQAIACSLLGTAIGIGLTSALAYVWPATALGILNRLLCSLLASTCVLTLLFLHLCPLFFSLCVFRYFIVLPSSSSSSSCFSVSLTRHLDCCVCVFCSFFSFCRSERRSGPNGSSGCPFAVISPALVVLLQITRCTLAIWFFIVSIYFEFILIAS